MSTYYTRFDGCDKEGLGSILQYQMHLYAYCKMKGEKYFFPGFSNISHHQYLEESKESFMERINDFFKFPSDVGLNKTYIDPLFLIREWGETYNDGKKKYMQDLFDFIKYEGPFFFHPDKNSVAVHIRNINPEDVCFGESREYFSPKKIDYFLNLIDLIRKDHGENLDIHIFSQGNENDFSIFKESPDCILHINLDLIETFYHLSTANILLTSNSSLSWCAHLFGKNKFVYSRNNFFHPWYSNVKLVDTNGNFIK